MRSSTSSSDRRGLIAWPAAVAILVAVSAYVVLEHQTLPGPWNSERAQTLFVGTSHTFDAIDPEAFDEEVGRITFADLDLQLAARTLERHRDRFPELGTLVVEVSDFSLLTDRVSDLRHDLGQITGELHLWSTSLPDRAPIWPRRRWKLRALIDGAGMPGLYWRRRPTLSRLLSRQDPIGEAPFAEVPAVAASAALTEARAVRRVMRLEALIHGDPEPNLVALESMVARARAEGLSVALVSYPLHRTFSAVRPPRWERVVEEVMRRSEAEAVLRLDYRIGHGLPDTAFKNVDHLSPLGATELSRRLSSDLEGLER